MYIDASRPYTLDSLFFFDTLRHKFESYAGHGFASRCCGFFTEIARAAADQGGFLYFITMLRCSITVIFGSIWGTRTMPDTQSLLLAVYGVQFLGPPGTGPTIGSPYYFCYSNVGI